MAADVPSRIPFNRPAIIGTEADNIARVFERGKFSGVGPFSTACNAWLRARFSAPLALVTQSGTDALEMAAILCELEPGDEVILPSFAFSSTATAFVREGARLVFVDVEPSTMNIDPDAIAAAVTPQTRVIVVLHYGGISCDMSRIRQIADKHDLLIVEDAAHALISTYADRWCGTLGHLGSFSFHETKNVHCGEGGALLVNDDRFIARAEIILEKGTDRSRFFRGEVDKYQWIDVGSSFVLGELAAGFLLAQLEASDAITADRVRAWNDYAAILGPAQGNGLEIADVPSYASHNGHLFWLKTAEPEDRPALLKHLDSNGIHATFHYVPLHCTRAGERFGRFAGADRFTSTDAARLVRLPMFRGLDETERIARSVLDFVG